MPEDIFLQVHFIRKTRLNVNGFYFPSDPIETIEMVWKQASNYDMEFMRIQSRD